MKILIAYDGSKDSEAAIDDLSSSGLPASGRAEVISVAEVWMPPIGVDNNDDASPYVEEVLRESRERGERAVTEAEMLAKFAASRVRTALPEWDVTSFASYGSPGWEIVARAKEIDADLIVVGAQGQSIISRLVLGSISQRVITEAHCSVRVGRGNIELDPIAERIIVGFDGSPGAHAAVDSVASRNWDPSAELKLVVVSEPVLPPAIGRFVTPVATDVEEATVAARVWIESAAEVAIAKIRASGFDAALHISSGNPKRVLPDEAGRWGADCIFMGATACRNAFERVLIGSTSAAVAARSHCSVEVTRVTVPANQLIDPAISV